MNYLQYRPAVLSLAVAALLMCPACAAPLAPGSQHAVFPASTGSNSVAPINPSLIFDLGIPPLPNLSDSPVRLKSVTIPSQPPELHILNVRAYNANQTQGVVIGLAGDLPTECPRQFKPHPIDSFILPARSKSSWYVVIAFTISKPGRYNLRRLRIDYTTNGWQGWQYLEIDTTMVVRGPPKPGPTPVPTTAVCSF